MYREIQGMVAQTESVLASKGIRYADLRTALVPQPDRHEIALVFDTLNVQEIWYGLPIHKAIIPLFTKP
jgi:hypothetical protein